MKISVSRKSDERWKWWMNLGAKTGCHQMADRSFLVHGYQFPVCARCTGVVIGYLIAIPVFLLTGYHRLVSCTGGLAMLMDWSLQQAKIKESTNKRRLLTGILGGFGIMSTQLHWLNKGIKRIRKN